MDATIIEAPASAAERILAALRAGSRLAPTLWDIAADITDRGVPTNAQDITTSAEYWGIGLVEASMDDPEIRTFVRCKASRDMKRQFWGVRREFQALLAGAA
jgi:hypothetical protein